MMAHRERKEGIWVNSKMKPRNCKLHLAIVVCAFLTALESCACAATFGFNDVEFWIGSGMNRAAVVIDWFEEGDDPPSLVWGYRWDGAATGADMLLAALAADERLFAKLGEGDAGINAIYGLGYDADDDGEFGVTGGAVFDPYGIAISEPSDGEEATDPGDIYAEGWLGGFWHYGVASSNPYDGGTWTDIPVGMASRTLTDGAWDGWTFTSDFDFTAFPTNPHAAAPPFPAGDYDGDGVVDAADYSRWKNRYGTNDAAADGNGNGIVDAADYTVWRNAFATSKDDILRSFTIVPEPHLAAWLPSLALFASRSCRRRRARRFRN
jgi:hypothetical protein